MGQFLRQVRQGRWIVPEDASWVPPYDVWADPLADLATQDNKLSVWAVGSADDVKRVLTGIAANRQQLSNVDYILFEDVVPTELGIPVSKTRGALPDALVNERHREFYQLTASRLAKLARAMREAPGGPQRVLPQEAAQMITQAIRAGRIDAAMLKPELRGALSKRAARSS